ncbi:MAG: hypothetical protein JSW07_16205 [bacterium]|nr:MAG: hypothetical protein JSW07_16205 [bacterium]
MSVFEHLGKVNDNVYKENGGMRMRKKVERKERIQKISVLAVLGMFVALFFLPGVIADSETCLEIDGSYRIDIDHDSDTTEIFSVSHENGTELIRVQEDGKVGIGTSSPRYKLHVVGNLIFGDVSGPMMMMYEDSTSGSEDGMDIGTNSMGDIYFRTVNDGVFTSRIWVRESTGNVGIGLPSPQARLHVSALVTSATDYYTFRSGIEYIGGSTMSNWYGMYVETPAGAGIITNKYALVTEAGAGNVGIGTTGPGRALEVNSADGYNLRLTYSDINGGAANYADFLTSNSMLTIQTSGTIDDIEIRTGSFDNAIYIDESASAVGIGTSSPQRSIHISGVMRLEPQSAAPSPASQGDIYMHDGTGTPNYPVLRVYDGTSWKELW